MIVRSLYGRHVVNQHIFGVYDIELESQWISPTGFIVKIDKVDKVELLIQFSDIDDPTKIYIKDTISFQSRYSKIL